MNYLLIEFYYILVCLFLAYLNKRWIKEDKPIFHGLNGLVHFSCWVAIFFLTHKKILVVVALPFIARLFFDAALDLFRGKSLNYVPVRAQAISDRIEKAVFGYNGILPKVITFLIILSLTAAQIIHYK